MRHSFVLDGEQPLDILVSQLLQLVESNLVFAMMHIAYVHLSFLHCTLHHPRRSAVAYISEEATPVSDDLVAMHQEKKGSIEGGLLSLCD